MTPTTFPYRDDAEGVRIRYEDLLAGLGRERSRAARAARVESRRSGRIASGVAGIVGALLIAGAAVAELFVGRKQRGGGLTVLLLSTWAAMGVVYSLAWVIGRVRERSLTNPPRRSADPRADLAWLETERPLSRLRASASALERASIAFPLIAISLLAPLTLHLLVWALVARRNDALASFDDWMRVSMVVVGHAHLVLAFLGYRFASRACQLSTDELEAARSGAEWRAYGFAVLASALPGAVLFLIPPVLTALTGLLFNPLAYRLLTGAVVQERRWLGVARGPG
jgi:hypothetical protein